MNIPLEFIENLAAQLPDANQFTGTCYPYEFIYQDHYYQLRFFVVSENQFSEKQWLYNPNHVQVVVKDGSHRVNV